MTAESVLVVAAHPDDEVLGCGGTMAWHRRAGDSVAVLILADGVASRGGAVATAIDERREWARRANAILGVTDLTLLSYPDNRMDALALLDVVQDIERVMARCRPTVVYTHHAGDVNIDHARTHHAVITACRPQPGNAVHQLLFFETPSSTE